MALITSCSNEWNLWLDIDNDIVVSNKEEKILNEKDKKINNIDIKNIKEISNKKELVKHDDWNIYLYDNWVEIDYLTTKAKKCVDDFCMSEITYDITNSKWTYWIVKKTKRAWECSEKTFYWYNFNWNAETLTELYKNWTCFLGLNSKLNWNILEVFVESPENITENPEYKWEVSISNVVEEWFKQSWINWIKKIDLNKKISIKANKLDEKYSNDSLINEWYKLNNLWNIKEYYKEEYQEPWLEYWMMGHSTRKTIYIQWDKVLDFEVNNWGWQNLKINNPNETNIIDLTPYNHPFQSIFNNSDWAKVVIIDLDTIKIVDKNNWINKIIWER